MASVIAFQISILFLYITAILFQLQFSTSKPNGFSFRIIPLDSPESPLHLPNLTQHEKIKMLIEISRARADYLSSISSADGKIMNPNNIQLAINRQNMYYLTSIHIGQPSTEVVLLVDTGASLIWTQCEPCKSCFKQKSKIYHSGRSTTYTKLPCKDRICQKPFKCVNGECVYKVYYPGANATTKGIVSRETFQMPLKNQTHKLFPLIIFGCGNDNQGFAFGKNKDNAVSGILGLGKASTSLINQLRQQVKGRFSYCLHDGSSYLRFGEDIILQGPNVKTTPFKQQHDRIHYCLNLKDISVGSSRTRFSTRHFIIDSGAPMTVLAPKAYSKVIRAFTNYYAGKLERVDGKRYGFELCYAFKTNFQNFATMTFHFEGADFVPRQLYFFDKQTRDTCVVLLLGKENILGAFHQLNTRFVYDINANVLQFAPENCSNESG